MLAGAEASLPGMSDHRTTPDAQASIGRYARDLDPALLEECERRLGDAIELFGYSPLRRTGLTAAAARCVLPQRGRGIDSAEELFRRARVLTCASCNESSPEDMRSAMCRTWRRTSARSVRGLAPVNEAEEEQLVARGIFLVRRIALALPPEASLQEALQRASRRGPDRPAGGGRAAGTRPRRRTHSPRRLTLTPDR